MDKCFEISSIFTVIVDNKNRKVRYFLLVIILFLALLIGLSIMIKSYLQFLVSPTLSLKTLYILQFINGYSVINAYFFLVFVCNWKRYVEFTEIWSQTGLQNDQEIINYINSQLKKYRRFFCLLHAVFTLPGTLSIYLYDPNVKVEFYSLIIRIFISFLYSFSFSLITDFPLQMALLICSVFIRVNQRLDNLIKHPDSTEDNIRSIRLLHSIGSQMTTKADQFICYYLATSYFLKIVFILTSFYRIIYLSKSLTDYLISISILFAVISMTAFVTQTSVKINRLASLGFQDAYQLSFTNNCPNHFSEISLLIYRMGRNDIGLTFANLFTITASFVTSFATLCITFILAFPTIRSQSYE